jgi:hypothetical protein
VVGGLTWLAISPNQVHSFGVAGSGQGYCWGRNNVTVLGPGSVLFATEPVAVRPFP